MTNHNEPRLRAGSFFGIARTNFALKFTFLKQTKSTTSPMLESTCQDRQGNPPFLGKLAASNQIKEPKADGDHHSLITSKIQKRLVLRLGIQKLHHGR
jgi:hypothetical protein